jgi:hypothetical protein
MQGEWILGRAYRFGRGLALMGEPHEARISFAKLAAKNRIKALVFPWLADPGSFSEAWERRWRWAYDQGFEDGILGRQGKPGRWRSN